MSRISGWPKDLVDPLDPEFIDQVRPWLLDRLPGEFRSSAIARSPLALAWILTKSVAADLRAYRQMYAIARGELGDIQVEHSWSETAPIDDILEALEGIGATWVRLDREVRLVYEALIRASGEMGSPHLD